MKNYKVWLRSFLLAIFLFTLVNCYGAGIVKCRHNEIMRLINEHHEFLRTHYPNFYKGTLNIVGELKDSFNKPSKDIQDRNHQLEQVRK